MFAGLLLFFPVGTFGLFMTRGHGYRVNFFPLFYACVFERLGCTLIPKDMVMKWNTT